jgi:predicted DsbA family dithiol-disulfide isomerase
VHARCWSDLCCPWCWLGRDRTNFLRGLGVDVEVRPYELHPEFARTGGYDVRPGGRLAAVFDGIARECDELGLPFVAPTRLPVTNRALRTLEVVRTAAPDAHSPLEDALYEAVWVEGVPVDDPDALDELVRRAGAESASIRAAVDTGGGAADLSASMDEARSHGIAGTPAWLLGELALPGVQPRAFYQRVVERLRARAADASTA